MSVLPRVIPIVQVLDGAVVKTRQHKRPAYIGHPMNIIRMFNEMRVDEIVVVDLGPKFGHTRTRNPDVLRAMSAEAFVPLSIGGGISTLEDVESLITSGFEKIIIGSAARRNPGFLEILAAIYGAQALIFAIDVSIVKGQWITAEWDKRNQSQPLRPLLARLDPSFFGEVLITDTDREGMRNGLDTDLIGMVSRKLPVPVIATGGARRWADLSLALEAGASAIGIGDIAIRLQDDTSVLVHVDPQINDGGLG